MPASLGAPQPMRVADAQFLPPANVGAPWGAPQAQGFQPAQPMFGQPAGTSPITMGAATPGVQTQSLPPLNSPSTIGNTQAMPAQHALAPMPAVPAAVAMGNPTANGALPLNSSVPLQATPAGGYMHTIASGESLYTIARKYDVTTQAIVQANSLGSPDRIVVGQKVLIPGRPDLIPATPASVPDIKVASAGPTTLTAPVPSQRPLSNATNVLQTPAAAPVAPPAPKEASVAPVQPTPAVEPAMSGNDKFRWPVSGRVITDFSASRGTGINIDVPEGSAVKAAENGTVIYVGSGVEGYGNLILVRHPNGYVSAYAHLEKIDVPKGAVVNRGDSIGTVGMTGSVSRPQLHFELRKGATPVDPVPLLTS